MLDFCFNDELELHGRITIDGREYDLDLRVSTVNGDYNYEDDDPITHDEVEAFEWDDYDDYEDE